MTTKTPQPTGTLLRPAAVLFIALAVLTGMVYPALVTGIAQQLFPHQANGSLIEHNGRPVGSRLIGQSWSSPGHFWGRPSATGKTPYDATASGGSNLGLSNPALLEGVRARVAASKSSNPTQVLPIPVELVTASASGLDPHVSPAAAHWQVPRVARARGVPEDELHRLVAAHTEDRTLGILGSPRVNVLELNLALDR
jgi:K+-transporting ATPase ATPase C chain